MCNETKFEINKTGMDRFQDCCKAKATNALLQSQLYKPDNRDGSVQRILLI